jgi:hypothetical protein
MIPPVWTRQNSPIRSEHCTSYIATSLHQEDTDLKSYWDIETIGIKDNTQDSQPPDDFETYQKTHLSTIEEGRYTAALPWKPDHPSLPSNYTVTEKRTRSMACRLNPELCNVYDSIIKEQECRDFIEKIEVDDVRDGHYLPHHPVKKDSETMPIRVVYD